MNLSVDIGNSSIKAGAFEGERLIWHVTGKRGDMKKLLELIGSAKGNAIVSTVADYPMALMAILKKNYKLKKLTEKTPLPFRNEYKSKNTLGRDRIACMAAAHQLFPRKNVLVINAGTCITADIISDKAVYKGGSISPGMEMRLKALHTFTARLPLISPDNTFNGLEGKTTKESILSGVQRGTIDELNGLIAAYTERYKNLNIILTGGWHEWLNNRLKGKIISEPFLTLRGLNVILAFCLSRNK